MYRYNYTLIFHFGLRTLEPKDFIQINLQLEEFLLALVNNTFYSEQQISD